MRYLAILKDSWVEALDRKSMWFLVIMSVLVILFCATISYRELEPEDALGHVIGQFRTVMVFEGMAIHPERFSTEMDISGFHKLGPEAEEFADGFGFDLKVSRLQEFHRLVHTWSASRRGSLKKGESRPPEAKLDPTPAPPEGIVEEFFRVRFREAGVPRVRAEAGPAGNDERTFRVRLRADSLKRLEGAYEVRLLFGLAKTRLTDSVANFLATLEYVVADWIAGWVGIIIAVIFTAGSVPGMLQKGSVDVILSRPVTRWGLLMTKYLGGLLYVLIPATFLVGGCWLVLSARAGYWNFGFLMCIPMLVALFAILYSFSLLIGVVTRSTVASILLTLVLWFFSYIVAQIRQVLPLMGVPVPDWATTSMKAFSMLLPKTTEIGQLTARFLMSSNLGPEYQAKFEQMEAMKAIMASPTEVVVSSVLFVGAMLGLACWVFSRRDQ